MQKLSPSVLFARHCLAARQLKMLKPSGEFMIGVLQSDF